VASLLAAQRHVSVFFSAAQSGPFQALLLNPLLSFVTSEAVPVGVWLSGRATECLARCN
jgi:hypothetical protein